MSKRLKIVMDIDRNILPDKHNNYVVGEWDGNLERAIDTAMLFRREILVIRPEGIELTKKDLYRR